MIDDFYNLRSTSVLIITGTDSEMLIEYGEYKWLIDFDTVDNQREELIQVLSEEIGFPDDYCINVIHDVNREYTYDNTPFINRY